MNFKYLSSKDDEVITKLFTSTFSSSEGEEEGQLIGKLSADLSKGIDNQNIICIWAFVDDDLVGSIFFTKLNFNNNTVVYMLAPVAVHTQHQKKWIGSSLIKFGINELKDKNVDIVITYGDPSFYSKTGFQKITEDQIRAPLDLSIPEWRLWQTLNEKSTLYIEGIPTCVEPFNNPAYW